MFLEILMAAKLNISHQTWWDTLLVENCEKGSTDIGRSPESNLNHQLYIAQGDKRQLTQMKNRGGAGHKREKDAEPVW